MQRAHPGAAYIVDKTRVPVLPVGIVGTTEDFFSRAIRLHRPTIEMRIGKPYNLPPIEGKGADRRAALQANADQIMLAIAALVPPEYRGIYQASEGIV
jgi:1-acyl-sn-glycerol-3-phosphate acyltransferase